MKKIFFTALVGAGIMTTLILQRLRRLQSAKQEFFQPNSPLLKLVKQMKYLLLVIMEISS